MRLAPLCDGPALTLLFRCPDCCWRRRVCLRSSVGPAGSSAADTPASGLLGQADTAMWSAKRANSGHVHAFVADMESTAPTALEHHEHTPAGDSELATDEHGRPAEQTEVEGRQTRYLRHRRHQIVQAVLLAVILGFLLTTVPGVRALQGNSWWMGGILQILACGATAALCLVRTPKASPDRTAWRGVALGLLFFGLSNTGSVGVAGAADAVAIPTFNHLLRVRPTSVSPSP